MDHLKLGAKGEWIAIGHLRSQGYTILVRNYRWMRGEIDVICTKKNLLVVVEVKTRASRVRGEPFKAITQAKQRQIIKVTNHFICENNIQDEVRFDVISIVVNQQELAIEHIKNAFYPLG